MTMDDKQYQEYLTLVKYKRSVLLDQFLTFLPLAAFMIVFSQFNQLLGDYDQLVFFGLVLVVFGISFVSDFIFKHQSLGKRIYHIEVVNQKHGSKLTIHSVIYRRFLEVAIHPMLGKTFLEKSIMIDKATKTRIIESKPRQ